MAAAGSRPFTVSSRSRLSRAVSFSGAACFTLLAAERTERPSKKAPRSIAKVECWMSPTTQAWD